MGCPWEVLNADDLGTPAETFEGLMKKVAVWKEIEGKYGGNPSYDLG